MHRLVLEDREHGLGAIEQRMAGPLQIAVQDRVEHLAIGLVRERANVVARWATAARSCPPLPRPSAARRYSCGSIPRANITSSRASMLGPPSAFLTSVLKLNAGR